MHTRTASIKPGNCSLKGASSVKIGFPLTILLSRSIRSFRFESTPLNGELNSTFACCPRMRTLANVKLFVPVSPAKTHLKPVDNALYLIEVALRLLIGRCRSRLAVSLYRIRSLL